VPCNEVHYRDREIHSIGDIIYYDDDPGRVVAVAYAGTRGMNSLDYQVFWLQTRVTTWVWDTDICSEQAYRSWLTELEYEHEAWSSIDEGEW
jgi:hypothetical protein